MESRAEQRRRQLLDAGRELLLDETYDMLAGLTLERVAERADVPVRTAKRDFTISEFREALADDLLRIRPGEDIDETTFVEYEGRLTDRSRPIGDEISEIVDSIVQHNVESDLFRLMVAFWAFSAHDPKTEGQIAAMYQQWLRDARDTMNATFMQHLDSMPIRKDWISIEDFIRAITALAEGLAIQMSVQESGARRSDGSPDLSIGVPDMDPDLPGKVAQTLLASMIEIDGIPSPGELFEEIEKGR